jgi:cytosine/adenosine deaminase-related metal-dependent hydrolase
MTLPGLANAHTHLYSGLVGLGMPAPEPPPVSFVEILERVWWRLDRALDAASLRAAARLYVAEALVAGTTAIVDHHESPGFIEGSLDVLADACQELGMRALLCYGATERNGGRDEARRGLEECRRFIATNDRPLVKGAVGLHASFTVSDETVREAGTLCRELGAVLHVHVAEDAADVADARARGYAGPVARLAALGALPPGSILAHGVHSSADEVRLAAERGCWIVQNPRSNRNNRVGYPAALHETPRAALGTDGFPADMLEEAAALRDAAREHGEPPGVAAKRLLGSLCLAAELFGLDAPAPEAGEDLESWLRARRTAARLRLEVDGRVVVRGGCLTTADLEAIREDARREAARLWSRMIADPGERS